MTKKPENASRPAAEAVRDWEDKVLRPTLEKHPERGPAGGQEEFFSTVSSLPIRRLYTEADLDAWDYARDLAHPGEYPYTRGVHPTMYRGRLWTMRMFSGFGTAKDTNERFRYLLDHGQTGLSTAFDMPTLMGYDSDAPQAEGEVGREGVAIDTIADMETLFDGIDLEQVSTSMTINAPAMVLYAMYLAVAQNRGNDTKKLRGTIQNDILKEYIAQKEWLYPPEPSLKIITDILEYSAEHVPQWNTISISGYHIREAGSTAVQELAFTLADGVCYVEHGIAAGLDVDTFAPRLSFFFNSHNDFFEEICKLRAARRIWARIMRERFGATREKSWKLRTHVQTAGCSLTAQQPLNNIIRVTIQALAAVLGGPQSLHTDSYDETLCLPTEEAARIALRTQQIIAEESGVANTIDPLAGSYFVESLTNEMEAAALAYIRKIDEMGGMVKAIEQGFPQREIQEAAFRYQQQVDGGQKTIVGINKYVLEEEAPPEILKISPAVEREQRQRLAQFKADRDEPKARARLAELLTAAERGENLMPVLIAAVKDGVTKGEISQGLKRVYGEYREAASF